MWPHRQLLLSLSHLNQTVVGFVAGKARWSTDTRWFLSNIESHLIFKINCFFAFNIDTMQMMGADMEVDKEKPLPKKV